MDMKVIIENNDRKYIVKGVKKEWLDLTTKQKRHYLRHIDQGEWYNVSTRDYYTIEQRQAFIDNVNKTANLKSAQARLQNTMTDDTPTLLKATALLLKEARDLDKVFDYSGKYEQIELDNMRYTGTQHWRNTLLNRLGYGKPWYPTDYWNKWKSVLTLGLVK